MANNYSTVKLDRSSEKIFLVRIKPARYITDDLSLDSGTTYELTFAYSSLVGVSVDGTAYTLVASSPSSGEYTFNDSTKALSLNLGTSLGSQVIVAYYYLFYTNNRTRNWYEDPEDTSSTVRPWAPRVSNWPGFRMAQRDIISGFLDIGTTDIEMDNHDNSFQGYLTNNDSFNNKEVKVWAALNKLENIKKLYEGKISSIDLPKNKVILSVDSALSSLNGTYFSNGTWLKSTFNTTTYANINPESENKPVPKFFSRVTYNLFPYNFQLGQSFSAGGLGSAMTLAEAPRAINSNFSTTKSTSTNRTWATYVANDTDGSFSSAISNVVSHGLNQYTLTVTDSSWFLYGDNMYINTTANVGYVIGANTSTTVRVFVNTTTPTTSDTIYRPEISAVHIEDPSELRNNLPMRLELEYNRDYTYSTDANGVRQIDLVNNFETNHSSYTGPLNPNSTVYYRAWNDDSLEHGDVVDTILTDGGLTLDSTSKTNANSTSIEMALSVPFKGSDSFPTRAEILRKILGTTLGLLALGSDYEIEYLLLDAPSTGSTTTSELEILRGTFSQQIDYKDLISEVNYFNPHGWFGHNHSDNKIYTNNGVSNKVKYLHDVIKIKDIEHVAYDTTNTFTRLTSLLYERRAYYNFSTKGQHFESVLGDDVTLSRDDIIAAAATKDVTIIELDKRPNATTIKATDLLDIT